MAITVISSPATVSPIGNQIMLELQTNNHFSVAGSAALLTFTFTGIDTDAGHLFSISYANEEITFTLAASPDDSGNQITAATGGQSVDDWMAVFAADLVRNYYIKRDFDVEVDTDADLVILTAKEKGTFYSVMVDDEDLANVALLATAGVDPVARDGFDIVLLTEILASGEWTRLMEDRCAPDQDGNAQFYLEDLFGPELTSEHTWPEVPEEYHQLRANHIKKYRLLYAELFDNAVKRLTTYPTDVYAILGAFDYKMVAGLNGVEYSLTDFITTYKSFLTWQPTTKVINRTQPEKLYFLVFNDIVNITLNIKVYYSDGTNSGNQTLLANEPVSQYQVYEFMVGFSQIDFTKWPAKEVVKYEIWLTDYASAVQSQVRTFILETKNYRHERIFLFRNSFGGFDTFRATGLKIHTNEYERMILEKNYKNFTLQQQYQVLEKSLFTINSGWITFYQRNWLRELLLSKEAYEIIGNYKFPIFILNEKRDLKSDDNYLHNLEINYKYNFKDPNYSGDYTLMPLLAENLEILLSEDGQSLFA